MEILKKGLLIFLCCIGFGFIASAQVDSATVPKTETKIADTVKPVRPKPVIRKKPVLPVVDTIARRDTIIKRDTVLVAKVHQGPEPAGWPYPAIMFEVFSKHPFYKINEPPTTKQILRRTVDDKDWAFYLFAALLLILGFYKLYFAKYFNDLQRLFFNTTLKQKQIREQMVQAALPSLLFNAYFVVSAGVYAFFLVQYYQLNPNTNRWILLSFCILLILVIYLIKFITLKFSGWIFDRKEAADTYIFIVFFLNKLLGVVLVPFSIVIAYARGSFQDIFVTLSFALIAGFFIYRFILSYSALRNELKISLLHFFLYLCAFEIVPVILIYKVLLELLERNL
jgi:hypothetical protein